MTPIATLISMPDGALDLEALCMHALARGTLRRRSDRQKRYENLLNQYLLH